MVQITCKELAGLSDLMALEQNMMVKCKTYASETTDSTLKNQYEQMAQRHQRHFDELYASLK